MRRAPIVLVGTAAGLAGVLCFHTASSSSLSISGASLGSGAKAPGSSTGTTTTPTTTPASTGSGSTGSTGTSGAGSTGSTGSTGANSGSSSTTTAPASSGSTSTAPRTATGTAVNYFYGILSVQVTATGTKITNVQIASLDDGGNPRSQSIDQQSIPSLEQEVIQAQNANIQGVSGATYTSQGFAQSLQSALSKLGI